jgi:hypothetical protein
MFIEIDNYNAINSESIVIIEKITARTLRYWLKTNGSRDQLFVDEKAREEFYERLLNYLGKDEDLL